MDGGWTWPGAPFEQGSRVVALLRHGRTAWNAERRFLGVSDVPLDAVGLAEADALGRALSGRFDELYCSPLCRARQTAMGLGPAEIVDDLRELHQGELEGLPAAEGRARYASFFEAWARDPANVPTPGGESVSALHARARAALDALADRRPVGRFAVVTHQVVIATLCAEAAGAAVGGWRAYGVGNVEGAVLVRDGGSWRVVAHPWCPAGADSS